jgi:biopolymer transport protein ExbB
VCGEDFRAAFGAYVAGKLGFEEAWQNRVDADVMAPVAARQLLGQSQQGGFCGGVCNLPRWRMDGGKAGNENEMAATSFDHAGQDGGGTGGGTAEVDGHDLIPCALRKFEQWGIARNASRTNQQINGTPVEILMHRGAIRHVEIQAARRGDLPVRAVKGGGNGAGKTAAATGDDQMVHAVGILWQGLRGWQAFAAFGAGNRCGHRVASAQMILGLTEPSGLIEQGGPLVWVLLGLAFIGTVCVIERLFFFHRARINVGDLLVGLAHHIRRRAFAEALHEAARAPGPVARVAHAAVLRYYLPRQDLRDVVKEAGQLEVPRIEKNMRAILGVALLAPLVGMLGTMVGMVETFQRVSEQGGFSGPGELSGGVFTALITSVVGLTVAVPMYLCYLYFLGRAKRLVHRLERAGIEMLNLISDAREESEFAPFRGEVNASMPVPKPNHDADK